MEVEKNKEVINESKKLIELHVRPRKKKSELKKNYFNH